MDMVQRPPAGTRADHQLKKAWSLRTRVFPLHFFPRRDGGRRAATPRRSAHTAGEPRSCCLLLLVRSDAEIPWTLVLGSWPRPAWRPEYPTHRHARSRTARCQCSAAQRSAAVVAGVLASRRIQCPWRPERGRTYGTGGICCMHVRVGETETGSASLQVGRIEYTNTQCNAAGERWKDSAGAISTQHGT